MKSRKYQKYFVIFILVTLGSYLAMQSSIMPFARGGYISKDTGVWLQIAKEMNNGKMVYRDLFDHKGPLLYLLFYLFYHIGGITGAWILQCLFLAVTITAAFWCAMKMTSNSVAGAYAVVSTMLVRSLFTGEDFPIEEIALPFMFISLFVFLSYFSDVDRKIKRFEIFILGFCMGSVLCLRPNMIALWFVFILTVLLDEINHKRYKDIWLSIRYFMAGFLTLLLLIGGWLYTNGALKSCWEEFFRFNFLYVDESSISSRIDVLKSFLLHPYQFVSICLNVFLLVVMKKDRILYGANLIYMLLNLVLSCMSGRYYPHYAITLIPGFLIPFAGGINYFWRYLESKRKQWKVMTPFWIISICLLMILGYKGGIYGLRNIIKNMSVTEAERDNQKVISYIQQNTQNDDKITIIGNYSYIYLRSDRYSATEFIYTSVCEKSEELGGRFVEQIAISEPQTIVIGKRWMSESSEYIKNIKDIFRKKYYVVLETKEFIIYEKE